ncbi:MAG: hypothetical protein ACI4UT_01535 [Candidatus Enteromonas sp.]
MKHPLTLTTCALALLLASCGGGEPSSTDSKVPPTPSAESSMTVPESSSPDEETSSPVEQESSDSSESTPDPEPSVETTSESSSESTPEESSSSSEDSSSEESSSVEEVYGVKLVTSGSGFSVHFLDDTLDLNVVEPETEVSFTLMPLAEYYVLSGVRASIDRGPLTLTETDGVYSFLMPYYDVTITVTGNRLYAVETVPNHATVSFLNEVKPYYASGEKIRFTATPEEGYVLDEVRYAFDGYEGKLSAGSDGIYEFSMPSSTATITCRTSEVIDATSDPWAGKPATYSGQVRNDADYKSTFTISFKGNGTFDFRVDIQEYYDDWGDYWEAPIPPIKREWTSTNGWVTDSSVTYAYLADENCFTCEVNCHQTKKDTLTFSVSESLTDGAPSSITLLKDIGSDAYLRCKGKVLTLR